MRAKKQVVSESSECFTVKHSDIPNEAWTTKKLTVFAQKQIEQISIHEKKVAIHVRRLGHALTILRDPKRGSYRKLLKTLGVSVATAWRATELFRRTESEEQVANLGITEAYIKYGIIRRSPDEEGNEEQQQGKKKKAATGAKVGKKGRKVAADEPEPDVDEEEEEEEEEEPDARNLFEEAAEQKGWNEQQQIDLLLDFWDDVKLIVLKHGLDDDGETDVMREFLAELDAQSPPAAVPTAPPSPEAPDSLLVVLTQMSSRLDLLTEEINVVNWEKESRSDYRSILDDIIFTARQIKQEVR
jgi:hypothetical protein